MDIKTRLYGVTELKAKDALRTMEIQWDKFGCPSKCPKCGNRDLDTVNHQWVCYKCGENFTQYNNSIRRADDDKC